MGAPWTIDANVAALAALLDGEADGPVVVVGHSFGGAVALRLAAARPDLVAALVLLDPAVGLDGGWMREIADAMLASPDYPDRAEARAEKVERLLGGGRPRGAGARTRRTPDRAARTAGRLADQPPGDDVVLERVGPPMSCCRPRELRRRWCAPTRTDPPYVTDELVARAAASAWEPTSRCSTSTATTWCRRRKPAETAALIRELMGG